MNPNLQNLDQHLARFLTQVAPVGSGPEARTAVLCALADVLGMYLAGNLAKEGRRGYRETFQELMDRTHGVAQLQATQLRTAMGLAGVESSIIGAPVRDQPAPTIAEVEARDPDGHALIVLSAMGAVIDRSEVEWWVLPGFPSARARLLEGSRVEMVIDGSFDDQPTQTWHITRSNTDA